MVKSLRKAIILRSKMEKAPKIKTYSRKFELRKATIFWVNLLRKTKKDYFSNLNKDYRFA